LTKHRHPALPILPNKKANTTKNWHQFFLAVKAIALKQQIPTFYLQILSTDSDTFTTGH